MNLDVIVGHLRQQVSIFGSRVAGAAKFEVLPEAANLLVPAAYVLPLNEQPEEQSSQNGYQQTVREGFAVVVALSNKGDERGQKATVDLDALRRAVFSALLAFQPGEDYDIVCFQGGQLLHLDRARMYYQLDFYADYFLDPSDTWIPRRNAGLKDFEGVDSRLDAVDVFDPNTPANDFPDDPAAYPGGAGPDGRAETGAILDLPQD